MGRTTSNLTPAAIDRIEPSAEGRRITKYDAMCPGLYVLCLPTGVKSFYLKIKIGVEKRIGLGRYPLIKLAEAREKANEIKRQVLLGNDPSAKVVKSEEPEVYTFANAAEDFVNWKRDEMRIAEKTIKRYRSSLNAYLLPMIGDQDITKLNTKTTVAALKKIDKNSMRVKSAELAEMIVRYAIQHGHREEGQLALRGLFREAAPKDKQLPDDVRTVLPTIQNYNSPTMQAAIKLQFLLFLRSGELMPAQWSEFDFENRIWEVPAERMKMKKPHVVPLSRHAIAILEELRVFSGETPFLFPSLSRSNFDPERRKRVMSHMITDSLSKAFRELGIVFVPHSCRTIAKTWLNSNGYGGGNSHLVELQLSHVVGGAVERKYLDKPWLSNLPERAEMMQIWSDYLYSLNDSEKNQVGGI